MWRKLHNCLYSSWILQQKPSMATSGGTSLLVIRSRETEKQRLLWRLLLVTLSPFQEIRKWPTRADSVRRQKPAASSIIKLELSWWDKLRARDSLFPVAPLFWQTCLWKKSCETTVLEWRRSTMPEHWTQHCQPKRIRSSYPLCVVCSVPFLCTWSDLIFFLFFFLFI